MQNTVRWVLTFFAVCAAIPVAVMQFCDERCPINGITPLAAILGRR